MTNLIATPFFLLLTLWALYYMSHDSRRNLRWYSPLNSFGLLVGLLGLWVSSLPPVWS